MGLETKTPPPKFDAALLAEHGIDADRLSLLSSRVQADIESNQYPGASFAIARNGQVLGRAHFGLARIGSDGISSKAADEDTLWLMYSQTKPVTSSALWMLAERGKLSLHDPVANYVPEFARHGKGDVTVFHVLTHQAGFPSAHIAEEHWSDSVGMKESICDFKLEWQPGSRVHYHGYACHWVQAMLIDAVSGCDFRTFIKSELLTPLGLRNLHIGLPDQLHDLAVVSYERTSDGKHVLSKEFNSRAFLCSGMPGAGGYATAADIALFYQMLLGLGELNGVRVLSPRMVQYATRNHTADRIDEFFGMPMHRALGVHVRGETASIRGLSSIASKDAFGHGGVGTSYSWADPETHVSFTYITNSRMPEPAHSRRLEEIMTMAHSAVRKLK